MPVSYAESITAEAPSVRACHTKWRPLVVFLLFAKRSRVLPSLPTTSTIHHQLLTAWKERSHIRENAATEAVAPPLMKIGSPLAPRHGDNSGAPANSICNLGTGGVMDLKTFHRTHEKAGAACWLPSYYLPLPTTPSPTPHPAPSVPALTLQLPQSV